MPLAAGIEVILYKNIHVFL